MAAFLLVCAASARQDKGGWTNLHLLLWKQLVAQLVRIELEGEKYSEKDVWGGAWTRFERKVHEFLEDNHAFVESFPSFWVGERGRCSIRESRRERERKVH